MLKRLLLAVVLMAIPTSVAAQIACGDRAKMLHVLRSQHGEVLIGKGISAAGWRTELFMSLKGSWTIVLTNPRDNSRSCLMATGDAWTQYQMKQGGVLV